MSETVYYEGEITLIKKLENETLEEQCKRLINEELPCYCDSYKEYLMYDYDKYLIYDDQIYSVQKTKKDCNDIFNITRKSNDTFSFSVSYYNGCLGFSEAIEYAFKDYNKKQEEKLNKYVVVITFLAVSGVSIIEDIVTDEDGGYNYEECGWSDFNDAEVFLRIVKARNRDEAIQETARNFTLDPSILRAYPV